jgi:hypothetical protein
VLKVLANIKKITIQISAALKVADLIQQTLRLPSRHQKKFAMGSVKVAIRMVVIPI